MIKLQHIKKLGSFRVHALASNQTWLAAGQQPDREGRSAESQRRGHQNLAQKVRCVITNHWHAPVVIVKTMLISRAAREIKNQRAVAVSG